MLDKFCISIQHCKNPYDKIESIHHIWNYTVQVRLLLNVLKTTFNFHVFNNPLGIVFVSGGVFAYGESRLTAFIKVSRSGLELFQT